MRNGREIVDEGWRWHWIAWADGKVYAEGYAPTREECDAAIDSLSRAGS